MQEKNLEVSKMSEREVLGSIILDESKITQVIQYLPSIQVFYMEDHQKIWSAIYNLFKNNKTIDVSTLANYLGEKGFKLTYYLTGLTENIVSKNNIETHAKVVYDLYIRRELWNRLYKFQEREFLQRGRH